MLIAELRRFFRNDVVNARKLCAIAVLDCIDVRRPDNATSDDSKLNAQQSPPASFTTFRNAFTATSNSSGPEVPP